MFCDREGARLVSEPRRAGSLGGRADACGLVIARPARMLALEPFFMEFIAGVESELSAHSVGLTLQLVQHVEEEMGIYRRWWAERRVDGVMMVDLRSTIPVSTVSSGWASRPSSSARSTGALPSVWHDDACRERGHHYQTALGHRRIAQVAGVGEFMHTRSRIAAFRAAVAEFGLPAVVVEHDSAEAAAGDRRCSRAGERRGDRVRRDAGRDGLGVARRGVPVRTTSRSSAGTTVTEVVPPPTQTTASATWYEARRRVRSGGDHGPESATRRPTVRTPRPSRRPKRARRRRERNGAAAAGRRRGGCLHGRQ